MKIVICGDTHIGAVFGLGMPTITGGNTRIDDYEFTLNYIVDYCIDNSIDVFVQTGDLFDSRNPSPEHMSIVNNALRRLSSAGIVSAVIMGNHDYRRSGNQFTSAISSLAAKYYSNVFISLSPEVIEIDKGGEFLQLLLIPYRDRKMYAGNTTEEDSILYEKEVSELIASCKKDSPIVAIGHNFFKERGYNDYAGLEVLPSIESFNGCDLIVMGHYHEFKILSKKPPVAIYAGSMERLNFGDEDIKKYFIEYETQKRKVKVIKSPSRDLINGNTDLSMYDAEHFWKALKEELSAIDFKDKIVRYNIVVQGKIFPLLKRSVIKEMIYQLGAFYVSKITIEPIFDKMVIDASIIDNKDDASKIKAFIEGQPYDDELKEILISEAHAIIGNHDSTIFKT